MLAWGFCGYYVSGWVSSVGLKGLLLGPSVLIQKTWCVSLVGSILILVLSSSFYLFCYYFPACKCNPESHCLALSWSFPFRTASVHKLIAFLVRWWWMRRPCTRFDIRGIKFCLSCGPSSVLILQLSYVYYSVFLIVRVIIVYCYFSIPLIYYISIGVVLYSCCIPII